MVHFLSSVSAILRLIRWIRLSPGFLLIPSWGICVWRLQDDKVNKVGVEGSGGVTKVDKVRYGFSSGERFAR